ncbi:MAG: rane protein, major facilitator superfamily [Holophagaceae bacterium]|nr:rane protein, major facilitator superfamily [Holophagaceae bacterium]
MNKNQSYPAFRWFVLLAIAAATIAQSVVMIAPAPLVGAISHDLGITPGAATAMVMATWNIVAVVSSLLAGFLVDRYGANAMMITGCILLIVPTLLFPFAGTSVGMVLFLRICHAFGCGPVMGTVAKLAHTWFLPKERGFVAGIQALTVSVGVAIGFITAPAAFVQTQNWLTVMPRMTVTPIIALVLWVVVLFGPKAPEEEHEILGAGDQSEFKSVLAMPITWLIIFAGFTASWFFSAFNDMTPGFLALNAPMGLGLGPVAAGKLMTLFQVAFMVGALAVGFLFEKLFRQSARITLFVGLLMMGVFTASLLSPAISGAKGPLSTVLFCTGFFAAWGMPTSVAFISLHYPARVIGRLTGLFFALAFSGGIPAILLGSLALHHTGRYVVSFCIAIAVVVIGALVSLFLKRPTFAARKVTA